MLADILVIDTDGGMLGIADFAPATQKGRLYHFRVSGSGTQYSFDEVALQHLFHMNLPPITWIVLGHNLGLSEQIRHCIPEALVSKTILVSGDGNFHPHLSNAFAEIAGRTSRMDAIQLIGRLEANAKDNPSS